jgi:DNA-binding CsgD family transcriptional regulator
MVSWHTERIEDAFAEAALDPAQWARALDTVADVTESAGALLFSFNGDLIPSVPFTDSISRSVETYFENGWHLQDERTRGFDLMVKRGVVDDLDIFGIDQIKRHPYYQEFLAPHHLRWYAGVKLASGDDLWALSIQRTIAQGPFSNAEKRVLGKLSNSLSSSAALARALSFTAANGALEAFEISGTAALLINRRGEVFKANRSAEQLLKGDIRIIKRKLVSNDRHANAEIERALQDLLGRPLGAGLLPMVCLPRSDRLPLLAHPVKLPSLTANVLADCRAAIILVDPEKRSRPPEAALRIAFQLTTAEARLALHLASGETLEVAAERLGIARDTTRNQLKNIFAKTGVNRQAELVATLASFLPIAADDPEAPSCRTSTASASSPSNPKPPGVSETARTAHHQ